MRKKKRFSRPQRVIRDTRINEEIKESKVRLLADSGTEIIDTKIALARAKEQGVDLIEIAKGQDLPIVKIIDYGRYKFEKAKKEKENKKKQKMVQVKEIKIGPKIDIGDFERKKSLAKEFLEDGDNIKVSMRFRGREMAHTELGAEKMTSFFEGIQDFAVMEKKPNLEGRMMIMVLRPKSRKS